MTDSGSTSPLLRWIAMRGLALWVVAGATLCTLSATAQTPPITVRPVHRPVSELEPLVKGVYGDDVRVLSDPRTNQLIVIGDRRAQRRVRKLVRRLDRRQPSRRGRNTRIYIHRLQHSRAKDIQAVLDTLQQTRGKAKSSRKRRNRSHRRRH